MRPVETSQGIRGVGIWDSRLRHTQTHRERKRKGRTRTSEAAQDEDEGRVWRAEEDGLGMGEEACSCITASGSKRCSRRCQTGQA